MAQMEPFQDRLRRFLFNDPMYLFANLIDSLNSFFVPELKRIAHETDPVLPYATFLASHAIIQTVSEKVLGLQPLDGTRHFLATFVDGNTPELKFSQIANEIHELRNVIAHHWLAGSGHSLGFDYVMAEGWQRDSRGVLLINPRIYGDCFVAACGRHPFVDCYERLSPVEAVNQKYRYLAGWLGLKKVDPTYKAIETLVATQEPGEREVLELFLRASIGTRHGIRPPAKLPGQP